MTPAVFQLTKLLLDLREPIDNFNPNTKQKIVHTLAGGVMWLVSFSAIWIQFVEGDDVLKTYGYAALLCLPLYPIGIFMIWMSKKPTLSLLFIHGFLIVSMIYGVADLTRQEFEQFESRLEQTKNDQN